MKQTKPDKLRFHPVTPSRWPAFEKLFGSRGACGGCWCMWWRLQHSEYEARKGSKNKSAMKRLIMAGKKPGILAYLGSEPVGWCAVAARKDYPRMARSRVMKSVDQQEVWSIPCLFVDRVHRRSRISVALLRAATEHAAKCGAEIVEGYPVIPKTSDEPPVFVSMGLASAYERVGFREVVRRSPTRPIMRWYAPGR